MPLIAISNYKLSKKTCKYINFNKYAKFKQKKTTKSKISLWNSDEDADGTSLATSVEIPTTSTGVWKKFYIFKSGLVSRITSTK